MAGEDKPTIDDMNDAIIDMRHSLMIMENARLMIESIGKIYPNGPDGTTFEVLAVVISVIMQKYAEATQQTVGEITDDFRGLVDKYNLIQE